MTPVVDAHRHVWRRARSPYRWLDSPGLETLRRDFGPDSPGAPKADGIVLVQADDTDADTDLMLEAAAADCRILGVVGWVPLDRPAEAERRLDALAARPVVGVRSLIHDRPDPDWLRSDPVVDGLALLALRGLPLDVPAVLPRHLEVVAAVADRLPSLTVIVDHLGKPPIGAAEREPWWSLIAEVAARPNVVAKVSGLYAGAPDPAAWREEDLDPWFDRAVEAFGPDRLLSGSDWPFSRIAGGPERTAPALARLLGRLRADEREAILSGTAVRVYGLDPARLR